MEQIKLHKQGDVAVIIIPASMIEYTGWEDGTLLDVLKINSTLHIRRKEDVAGLVTKPCPAISSSEKSEKLIRYNSGLRRLINELTFSARRVFFLCLYYYFENKFESNKSISIRADKYAEFVGVDRSVAYRQMKDAADFLSRNKKLITNCDYISNEGLLCIMLSSEMINYIAAVDASTCHVVELPLKSALSLQGRYSWPLYQLIKISHPLKTFTIGVDELKEEIDYVYNQKFSFFKRDAINIAIDEITERTDIKRIKCVNAERQGRRVSKIRFEIERR
ncbi:replication initiation protein [Salmonella enterica]|nr:replication initiation protein [Salmonella enterica subsp. enterica serovar Rubislaw]